jgi:hypothetical protein
MMTAWTKRIKNETEKAEYAASLRNSRWILDDLSLILIEMERELDTAELNPNQYDSPNWEYRQADLIGQRRILRKVKRIINLDQKEEQ